MITFPFWIVFWICFVWLIAGLIVAYFAGWLTGLIHKHRPASIINVNVGVSTTLLAMILGLIWYQNIGLWIILANAVIFFALRFWWQTDESKQWVIWGTYMAINTVLNLAVFGLIWMIAVKF